MTFLRMEDLAGFMESKRSKTSSRASSRRPCDDEDSYYSESSDDEERHSYISNEGPVTSNKQCELKVLMAWFGHVW